MTGEQFREWLHLMSISAAEAARRLDVSPNTITRYKKAGGPRMLRLACLALFHRLED
jgi:transcriptional regulator with XRE-family HTH domain